MAGKRSFRLAICLLFLAPAVAASDITPFAFRGSANQCQSYMIFEFGMLSRVSESGASPEHKFLIPIDIGFMKNVSPKCAVGGSLHTASDDDFTRVGFRPRVKLWTGKRSGWDFSLGPILSSGVTYRGKIKSPGLVSGISYSIGELISIDLYYESYRLTAGDRHSALYLGATGRSYMALVTPAIILVGIALSGGIEIGS